MNRRGITSKKSGLTVSRRGWTASRSGLKARRSGLKVSRSGFTEIGGALTLSPTALLPPSYPTALGLIGPSKKGHRLRAISIAASPLSLPQCFQLLFFFI
jgi:hypothetical protein